MIKRLFLLMILTIVALCSSCDKKETVEDLTLELTGEYIGEYINSNEMQIDSLIVEVSKIDNINISISPKNSNEFESVNIEISRVHSSRISSPSSQFNQLANSVEFAVGEAIVLDIYHLLGSTNGYTYSGIKK